jgi:putative transposase
MRQMGLAGMAPGRSSSRPHPVHTIYPSLLRGVPVIRPNQVWQHGPHLHPAGVWVRLPGGDHRLVLAPGARLANQQQHGWPGRVFDNIFVERLWRSVKNEDAYLKGYASMGTLLVGLAEYSAFYTGERPHQSLGQKTPDVVYRTAIGGGAVIVDKFAGAVEGISVERSRTATPIAAAGSKATAKTKVTVNPGRRRPAVSQVECAACTE